MATDIKAIKCPQCGSTQNTQISPGFFKCSNCGTEYFLDNDTIVAGAARPSPPSSPPPAAGNKKAGCGFIIILAAILAFFGIVRLIVHYQSASVVSNVESSEAYQDSVEREHYSGSTISSIVFARPGDEAQPLLGVLSFRDYMNNQAKNGLYLSFYDILKQKMLSAKQIDQEESPRSTSMRRFSNGEIYVLVNSKRILLLDRNKLDLEDVSTAIFRNQPKLQSGMATVDFTGESQGDGFRLLTNDGMTLIYYPLVDQLYTQNQFDDASDGFKSLLKNNREKVYFDFTTQGIDFPDDKLQLMKFRYKENVGGPVDRRYSFSWRRDYGRSGIFTDADPYTKVLVSKEDKDAFRIISFTDLTPGRLYFDPSVVLGDDQDLLITFKVNAAPDAATSLQSLDVNTGAVKWTLSLPDRKPETVTRFSNGYVALWSDELISIDTTGKTISQYKFQK